jgi:hypothetical protein
LFFTAVLSTVDNTAVTQNSWVDWTGLASTVQQWVDSPSANYGVEIVGTNAIEDRFNSAEFATDATLRPKLIITYLGSGPAPDTEAPTVTVNKAHIFGTASDNLTRPAEVTVSGTVYTVNASTGAWQTGDLTVTTGANTFSIVGVDASDNSRTVNLAITLP